MGSAFRTGFFPVPGPMARSVNDLCLWMSAALCINGKESDENDLLLGYEQIPIPWKLNNLDDTLAQQQKQALRVGYCIGNDGSFIEAAPANKRAVNSVCSRLESCPNIRLVPVEIPKDLMLETMLVYYSLLAADGGYHILKGLEGEPIEKSLKRSIVNLTLPKFLKTILKSLLIQFVTKDETHQAILRAFSGELSVIDEWSLLGKLNEQKEKFWSFYKDSGIDVLLYPCFPLPAIPHGEFGDIHFAASYTAVWNALDASVGSLPTAVRVDPALDTWNENAEELSELGSILQRYYDPIKSIGVPVGVQIVSKPFHEEEVLLAMKLIEDAMK